MNSEVNSPGLTPVCALRLRFSLHRQLLLLSTPGSLKGNGSFDLKSFYLYNLFNMEPRGRGILNCLSWTKTELKTVIVRFPKSCQYSPGFAGVSDPTADLLIGLFAFFAVNS